MSQNRKPPAYQEYAAAMLANMDFRMLSLAERGLLYTMRLECWENQTLPADPKMLGLVLSQPEHEVAAALKAVLKFFFVDDEGIKCPELDDYRVHLAEIRQKQSAGGKAGARITNANRSQGSTSQSRKVPEDISDSLSYPASDLSSLPAGEPSSRSAAISLSDPPW